MRTSVFVDGDCRCKPKLALEPQLRFCSSHASSKVCAVPPCKQCCPRGLCCYNLKVAKLNLLIRAAVHMAPLEVTQRPALSRQPTNVEVPLAGSLQYQHHLTRCSQLPLRPTGRNM